MEHRTTDKDTDRLAVWRLVTQINDTLYKRHFSRGAWMSDLVDYHVGMYAAMFEIEGRPARASKLADYLGMPRETVRRSLHRLVERSLLRREGDYFLMTGNTDDGTLAKIIDIIEHTAREFLPRNGERRV